MSPKSPKNGKPTLPSVATSLPLLAAFAAIRQNVKLPVPANPLQSSLCPHPSHESFSKSGKNGNVHHPSQHCHNPLPPFPLLSSFPSSLRLLLIPPCSSASSVVNSRISVLSLRLRPPAARCTILRLAPNTCRTRRRRSAVPSHVPHRGRPRPVPAQSAASR